MFLKKNKYLLIALVIIATGASYFYINKKKQAVAPAETDVVPKVSKQKTLAVSSVFFTDMEDPDPQLWMGAKSPEKYFSGKFSNQLSPQTDFSITFSIKGMSIKSHEKIKQAKISFQLFCDQPLKKASIVYSVTGKGEKVHEYFQEAISGQTKSWNNIEFVIDVNSSSWDDAAIIKIYVWNEGKEDFYMDDIKIEFLTEEDRQVFTDLGPKQNFLYDFEPVSGTASMGNLSNYKSHSGSYSILLSGPDTYSENIIRKFSEVANDTVAFISTSAWIYPEEDDPIVVLVVAIENKDGKSITWQGKATDMMHLKKNKWHKINFRADLREVKPSPDDVSKVYLWNKKGGNVYFDDLEIVYGDAPKPTGGNVAVYVSLSGEISETPSKNKPPFRHSQFSQVDGLQPGSNFFIDDAGKKEGEMNKGYPMISGNFFGHPNSQDDIFISGPNSWSLYSWCASAKKFFGLYSSSANVPMTNKIILRGHFENQIQDEILLIDTMADAMMESISFSRFQNSCDNATGKINHKKTTFEIPGIKLKAGANRTIVGNFSKDKLQEVLTFSAEGNWKLLEKKQNRFSVSGSGNLSIGTILSVHCIEMENRHDMAIVFYEKNLSTDYCVLEFSSGNNTCSIKEIKDKSFLHFYNSESIFFSGNFNNSAAGELFYFDDSWRFDLKKVKLDAQGLTIESMVDFVQTDPDRNPKYYEFTKIISGNFFGTGVSNFLVIMRNCIDVDFNGKQCNEFEEVTGMPSGYMFYKYNTGE